MEISTEGIFEIRMNGKQIELVYTTEEKCYKAMDKFQKSNEKWLKENFPNGIFEE